jgi:hypothetical protein
MSKTAKPIKFEVELGFKKVFLLGLMFLTMFVLPVRIVEYLNSQDQQGWNNSGAPQVAGLFTDNTGRYLTLPLVNFQFDTTLREPSTITFLFGTILIVIALLIVVILFKDFRKREHKYSS